MNAMARICCPLLALCILSLFSRNALAAKKGFNKFLYDNFSYAVPAGPALTKEAISNAQYKVHVYGSLMEGTIKENPPYSFVPFDDGIGAVQDANMQFLAIEHAGNPQDSLAAFLLNAFDGSNHEETHLCFLRPDKGRFHVNQALIGAPGLIIQGLRLERGIATLDVLFPGPDDPACCPTQKGELRFAVENDKIIEISSMKKPGEK